MPPLYVYECESCGKTQEETRTVSDRKRSPKHACGRMRLVITGTHRVIGSFEPYRAVGLPGQPWIKSRTEHKAQLRRHGRVEIGNDRSMAPEMDASDAEWSAHQSKRKAQIESEIAEGAKVLTQLGE